MLVRIIVGAIVAGIGVLMVLKANWLLENFGRSEWAEAKIPGGSRSFYKLVGCVIIVIGFFIITNLISKVLTAFAELFV